MACNITLDTFKGIGVPAGIGIPAGFADVLIEVSTKGCKCSSVEIIFECRGGVFAGPVSAKATKKGADKWQVLFDRRQGVYAGKECRCGDSAEIHVNCLDGSGKIIHSKTFRGLSIKCEQPKPNCPSIKIGKITHGKCFKDGTRETTIAYEVDNPTKTPAMLTWHVQDGNTWKQVCCSFLAAAGKKSPDTQTFRLKPGTHNIEARINKTLHPGCPPHRLSPQLVVPACKCPTITKLTKKINKCDDKGFVKVDFSAEIAPGDTGAVKYYWDFGQNSAKTAPTTIQKKQPVKASYTYKADGKEYTVKLIIDDPSGCSKSNKEIKVKLPTCKRKCPELNAPTYTVSKCKEGKRTVTFVVSGDTKGLSGVEIELLDITDGENKKRVLKTFTGLSGKFSKSHVETRLKPGKHKVRLNVKKPSDAACSVNTVVEVTVEKCEEGTQQCPKVEITVSEGDCKNGKRELSASVVVTPKSSKSVTVKLVDVTDPKKPILLDKDSGTKGFSLTGKKKDCLPGSTHTFEVVTDSPSKCKTESKTFKVSPCPKKTEPKPPDSAEESLGCLILRVLSAGFFATLLAVLILTPFKLPILAPMIKVYLGVLIALTAGALLFFLLYWFLCPKKECQWGLIYFGQVFLGAGLIVVWMSQQFLLPLLLIGISLMLIGLGFLAGWKVQCKRTWCDLADHCLWAILGVAIPFVSVIAALPVLVACLNAWAGIIATIVVALIRVVCKFLPP